LPCICFKLSIYRLNSVKPDYAGSVKNKGAPKGLYRQMIAMLSQSIASFNTLYVATRIFLFSLAVKLCSLIYEEKYFNIFSFRAHCPADYPPGKPYFPRHISAG
jgi:hypothetical protein